MTEAEKQPTIPYRETEEIQQILGRPPGCLLRWGITLVLGATALLLLLGWIYRYPDVITAPAVLQTEQPPIRLVAPVSAPIGELLVADGETVREDALLLVLQNPIDRREVDRLTPRLTELLRQYPPGELADTELPEALQLGELQEAYAALLSRLTDLRQAVHQTPWDRRRAALQEQIRQLQLLNRSLERQETTLQAEVDIARRNFEQYRALMERGAASELEFEEAETAYLRYRRELENMQTRRINNDLEIARLQSRILDLRQTENETRSGYATGIREQARILLSQIQQWEARYLVRAPAAGRVSFTGLEAEQQFISAGEELLTLLPDPTSEIVIHVRLPAYRLGKVQAGTPVQVRLDAYPYPEFGVLTGTVTAIAPAPSRTPGLPDYYRVEVTPTRGLTTTYGRTLDFRQQMSGQARLITENRSLLARLFDQMLHLRRNRAPG